MALINQIKTNQMKKEIVTPKEPESDIPSYNDEIVRSNTLYHDEKLHNIHKDGFNKGVKAGVQWQKERSFTIEEIKDALKQWTEQCTSGLSPRFTEYLLSGEWKNLKK